jgi:hypothetical protein
MLPYVCETSHYSAVLAEDIVLLVPYVGQLTCMRKELQKLHLRMAVDERDAEELQKQEESKEEAEEDEGGSKGQEGD